jgi:hypothetical protein
MVIPNSLQEAIDLEKIKPKLRKSMKAQEELEKNGCYVKVKDGIQNIRVFKTFKQIEDEKLRKKSIL